MIQSKGKRTVQLISNPSVADTMSPEPSLDRAIQSRIGDQLRAMYDDLMEQPVPDRFKDLLVQLQQQDAGKAQ